MTSPFSNLFKLEQTGPDRFLGHGPETKWRRVYGGLVVSQALAAAMQTVEPEKTAHSMHCYFLLPGDTKIPISFEVERLRDGRSFATRSCRAIQNGKTIFIATISWHAPEHGLDYQVAAPEASGPETLLSFAELRARHHPDRPRPLFEYFTGAPPLEFRPTNPDRYFPTDQAPQKPSASVQSTWFRTTEPLADALPLHQCVLAYASDMPLLDSTLIVHGRSVADGTLQPASLDHTIWFHRPFRADDWLLFAQESPNTNGARGLALGRIFTRDGQLVASVAQEGLIRPVTN